jgi:hypothetical protein
MRIRTTRLRLVLALAFLVSAGGLLPETACAETRTAADLTPEAVWEAVNAAKDGDTVLLPEGTAVWKKGWNAGHGAKMKAITIQGAGIDKTIIRTDTKAGGDKAFAITGVEGKPFRITGITFDGTGLPTAGTWAGEVIIGGNCKNFRVDHCKFLNINQMMTISGDTCGLIDHCYFLPLEYKGGLAQTIMCMGPGKVAFTRPLTLGTDKAVYFEDNEARFSPEVVEATGNNPWIVPYHGARAVIRHNKIINTQLEIYRLRPGAYGSQSCEVYDNLFSAEGAKQGRPQGFIFVAGGVAMVFNNTVTGTTYNCKTIQVSHDRSFHPQGEFGVCDGKNPLDGNQIPAGQKGAGYPAFGQPGRATDADGDGVFEPSPCYAWNNTLNGAKLNMVLRPWGPKEMELQAGHVQEGRDFFNEEPKPEYYKPYVYPHPLQEGWEERMKSAACPADADAGSSSAKPPAGKP